MRVIGVDIGGTFTDLALYDTETGATHVHKVPSTPDDPGQAMVTGLSEICAQAGVVPKQVDAVFHGTTVATNAVLQHRGATAGLITTKGFRDVVHIGRHQRPQNYSIMQDIPWQARPFVKRRHRKVVTERILPPAGEVLEELNEDEVREAARSLAEAGVEAVAICFLFSYLNPEHERRAAAIVREEMPGAFVTASAGIFPQFREFERFTTACMNAFVGPGTPLPRAARNVAEPRGRTWRASRDDVERWRCDHLGCRGEAGHPAALRPGGRHSRGAWAGELSDRTRLITFRHGRYLRRHRHRHRARRCGGVGPRHVVAGYPLLVPMLGRSHDRRRRRLDRARRRGRRPPRWAAECRRPTRSGVLRPRGEEPTITDANVVLGRIDPDRFLGGEILLDRERAVEAVQALAGAVGLGLHETAEGIITIANASMARAIRSRTIEKGHDPRDFTLVAFGGARPTARG